MKTSEIRALSNEELTQQIHAKEREFIAKQFEHKTNPLKNSMILRLLRKDIARLKTILKEKEIQKAKTEKK
ncbi:MAG: 50S ribosomal protein L29 [Elusimicrobiota bacterium]